MLQLQDKITPFKFLIDNTYIAKQALLHLFAFTGAMYTTARIRLLYFLLLPQS